MTRKSQFMSREARDDGMSFPEFLVAAVMSMVLAAAVAGVVIGALNISARSQANAGTVAMTQGALSNFSQYASSASRVLTATTTSVAFIYPRGTGVCEKHVYSFVTNASAFDLTHAVTSVTPSSGDGCSAVTAQLTAGTIGTTTTVTELSGLTSGSFSYFGPDGMQVPMSGDAGYNAAAAVPVCQLGSVQMNLVSPIVAEGNRTTNSESVRAAFRANVLGIGC